MNVSILSRRRFLQVLSAAGAATAFPPLRVAAETHAARASGAFGPEVIHVFEKPFTGLSYDETAALISDAGFGGIDFTVRPGGHITPERVESDLPRAVAAARARGLRVDTITTAITRVDDSARRILACAAGLGITVYRLGNFTYERSVGPWRTVQSLKPQLAALAALNEQFGLHGGIQNHTGTWRVGALGWDLHELLRELDPRWIGCQFDIRHATSVGGGSWPVMLDLLAPWIRSLVVKDFRWQQSPGKQTIENVPLGVGVVDLPGFFAHVRNLNLQVVWSLHFEYPPFEPAVAPPSTESREQQLAALRRDQAALAQLIAGPTPSI